MRGEGREGREGGRGEGGERGEGGGRGEGREGEKEGAERTRGKYSVLLYNTHTCTLSTTRVHVTCNFRDLHRIF